MIHLIEYLDRYESENWCSQPMIKEDRATEEVEIVDCKECLLEATRYANKIIERNKVINDDIS